MKKRLFSVFFVCLTLLLIPKLFAENRYGRISGVILNKETGLPVPDALLKIENSSMGTSSQSDGFYFFENVPLETCDITITVLGFEKKILKNVKILQNNTLNIELTPKLLELEPVLVTATRSDHLHSKITMSSEILTGAFFKDFAGETAGEVLNTIKGTYLLNNGGFAGLQTFSIRGSGSDQILVLLDGQRLNTAQGGGVDLTNIPINGLERIEILKGALSALYGSDAMGGTINIITKDPGDVQDGRYNLNTTFGSFGLQKYHFRGTQKFGKLNFIINYNHLQSDGNFEYQKYSSNEKLRRVNNDFRSDNLFFKTNFNISPGHRLQLFHQSYRTNRGIAGMLDFPTTAARRMEKRFLYSIFSENRLSNRISLKEQISYQTYRNHYKDPNNWIPTSDQHFSRITTGSIQATYLPFNGLTLTSGVELNQEILDSSKLSKAKRDYHSVFVQTEFESLFPWDKSNIEWRLVPAVRLDKYPNYHHRYSPKLGFKVHTVGELSIGIHSNYGTSFRMPSFNDLFWPYDEWSKGNPSLLPESSKNFDIGLLVKRFAVNSFQIELNYFKNIIEEFINWIPSEELNNYGYQIWSPQNIGKANIAGMEFGLSCWFFRELLTLKLNHTYLKALDVTAEDKETFLIYRPKNKFDFSTNLNFNKFTMNFCYQYTGKRFTQADNSVSLPAYGIWNSSVGYGIDARGAQLDFRIQGFNIFNRSVYAIQGYPMPGRELRISFGIQL
jgi:vitamin B12 transporter